MAEGGREWHDFASPTAGRDDGAVDPRRTRAVSPRSILASVSVFGGEGSAIPAEVVEEKVDEENE